MRTEKIVGAGDVNHAVVDVAVDVLRGAVRIEINDVLGSAGDALIKIDSEGAAAEVVWRAARAGKTGLDLKGDVNGNAESVTTVPVPP